jgi:ERCC4-type nuclease
MFGSVEKVFTASFEELMEVKGIGKRTARRTREILEDA